MLLFKSEKWKKGPKPYILTWTQFGMKNFSSNFSKLFFCYYNLKKSIANNIFIFEVSVIIHAIE